MNRETAKQNLIALGVAEPTDEAVTSYLNQMNGELKREKDRADRYKTDAEKTAELQALIDEMNAQQMSDVEKANAATKKAETQIAELQKQLSEMKMLNSLAESGIVGDDATALVTALSSGDLTAVTTSFAKIVNDAKVSSASAKEKELLENTPNPEGQAGGDKSVAEQLVATMYGGGTKSEGSILSHYLNQ